MIHGSCGDRDALSEHTSLHAQHISKRVREAGSETVRSVSE